MEEGKYWWQSIVFRAGISAIVIGGVQVYCAFTGAQIDIEALRGIVDNVLGLLCGGAVVITGLFTIFGRIRAILPIKKKVLPPLPWKPSDNPTLKE